MKRRDFIKQSIALGAGLSAFYCGKREKNSPRVVILGFDGANWPTIDPLIKKGKLPYLKKLKEESAWSYFKTFRPAKSSVVWTSIATGKSMLKHGIMDFYFLKKNRVKAPYSNSERREPTLWQILDSYGKRSVVNNWFASHPPDKINGIIVSDHFRRMLLKPQDKMINFRKSVSPRSYFDVLKKFAVPNYNFQQVQEKINVPNFKDIYMKKFSLKHINENFILKNYPAFLKMESLVEDVSYYLYNHSTFDFFATYFRLPDLTQHIVLRLMDEDIRNKLISAFKNNTVNPSLIEEATLKVSDILEPVYQYMEKIIKTFITNEKHKETYFFLMSDHGFSFYPGGYNHYNLPEGYEPPDGFFLAKGPGVKPGEYRDISVYDIVPTILYAFNLPVGIRMDGRPIKKIFKFSRKIKHKSYQLNKNKKLERDDSSDKDTLKELKTIGYID